MRHRIVILLSILFLLGGCYSKPVRHLASDASLIKIGESNRQDVLRYLGEPNAHRTVSPGVEEYVYSEIQRTLLQRTPVIGSMISPEGYETLIVTLSGDRVTNIEFKVFNKNDLDWADDFTWEKAK